MHQKQTPVIWMVTAITDDTEARKKKGRKKKKKDWEIKVLYEKENIEQHFEFIEIMNKYTTIQ